MLYSVGIIMPKWLACTNTRYNYLFSFLSLDYEFVGFFFFKCKQKQSIALTNFFLIDMIQVPLFHCSSVSVGADSVLHQEPRISLELKNYNVFVKNPYFCL